MTVRLGLSPSARLCSIDRNDPRCLETARRRLFHPRFPKAPSPGNGKFAFDHQPCNAPVAIISNGETEEAVVQMCGPRRCLPSSTRMNCLSATSWELCRRKRDLSASLRQWGSSGEQSAQSASHTLLSTSPCSSPKSRLDGSKH